MIYLIRHATAAGARPAAPSRPLSAEGWQEAAGLTIRLAGAAIGAVISSPAVHCVQTAAGLAARRGLKVTQDPRLGAGCGARLALLAAAYEGSGGVVLCTHADVVAAILAELRQRGVPLPPGDLWPPASIWAFTTRHGAVRAASHIPPLRIRDSA